MMYDSARAVESSLAVAELVAFVLQLVGERFERVAAARVQLEDADERFSLHRVGLHGLVSVVDVHVAEWCRPGGPALAHLLIEPLEHLGTQIVAVVLSDGGHDVERECSGRAGAELVVDEGEPNAAGVFQFLKPHRISHVAADAIQLVAQNRVDLLSFCVYLHPLEHLVESDAVGSPFGRLGNHELADDGPAIGLCAIAVETELCVYRIPFTLLAG